MAKAKPAKKKTAKKTTAKAKKKPAAKATTAKKAAAKKKTAATKKKASKSKTAKTASKTKTVETVVQADEVTIDRRRDDGGDVKIERREKVDRRRQIDPTTCERDYSNAEVEFMQALDDYKRKNGRMFPTCSEVLEVIRELGYVQQDAAIQDVTAPAFSEEAAADGEAVAAPLADDVAEPVAIPPAALPPVASALDAATAGTFVEA